MHFKKQNKIRIYDVKQCWVWNGNKIIDALYNHSNTKLKVPVKDALKVLNFSGCWCIRLKFHAKFAYLFKDKRQIENQVFKSNILPCLISKSKKIWPFQDESRTVKILHKINKEYFSVF